MCKSSQVHFRCKSLFDCLVGVLRGPNTKSQELFFIIILLRVKLKFQYTKLDQSVQQHTALNTTMLHTAKTALSDLHF